MPPSNACEHLAFMQKAIDLARHAFDTEDLPIAALVVDGDQVIGQAHNRVAGDKDLLAHAEMRALLDAHGRLSKLRLSQRHEVTVYTTLEPCMMCFGAIMNYNIGHVVYALESPGDGVEEIVKRWEKRNEQLPFYRAPETVSGVLRNESADLFRSFSKKFPHSRFATWTTQLAALVPSLPGTPTNRTLNQL